MKILFPNLLLKGFVPLDESLPESVTLGLHSTGFLVLSFLLLCIYYSNNDPSVLILSILSVCTLCLLFAAVSSPSSLLTTSDCSAQHGGAICFSLYLLVPSLHLQQIKNKHGTSTACCCLPIYSNLQKIKVVMHIYWVRLQRVDRGNWFYFLRNQVA